MNMLKMKDLTDRFKVNRTTIYRWMDKEGFPRPMKLANTTNRWRHEDIEKWEQRTQGGDRRCEKTSNIESNTGDGLMNKRASGAEPD